VNIVGPETVVAPVSTKLVPVALLNIKSPVFKVVKLLIAVVVDTPFTDEVRLAPSNPSMFELTRLNAVEEALPLTVELIVTELTPETELISLTVLDATASVILRLADTPFTLDIIALPELVKVLEDITEDVATTPFTSTVRVLPEIEADKLLIMLAAVDTIPLMMVVSILPVDVASELLIMDVEDVETTPFTLDETSIAFVFVDREIIFVVLDASTLATSILLT
jgi:hypothetical protein